MGIRFYCPNGHKLNVKSFQAGRRGICPYCGAKIIIPTQSTRRSGKAERSGHAGDARAEPEQEIVLQTDPGHQSMPGEMPAAMPLGAAGVSQPVAAEATAPISPFLGGSVPTAMPVSTPGTAPYRPVEAAPVMPMNTAAPVQSIQPAAIQPESGLGAQSPLTVQPPPSSPSSNEPPDPLDEAGNVVWYVRPPSGGQFGPATCEVMRAWIGEGRVSNDSLVWREGWRDWLVAGEVFPQLGAGKSEFGLEALGAAETATRAALGKTRSPRSRRQETIRQTSIITLLILAVIVLIGVFVWVVFFYNPAA